jgi:radical SAM family uncharacterized protein/radical SAM-linked protein
MSTTPDAASAAALTHAIESMLPLVEKPARYLDSEINAVHRAWEPASVKWLLALPDIYEIGMSHQGLRILYDLLNRDAGSLAERAFAPWIDMEARMRARGVPLFSLESRRPAREFDVIGFSWPYELLATNLLNLLDLARVPLWSRERGETDPLVAVGGPCTGNPEPLADFIDFFLIGDGEEAVREISRVIGETRGQPREARLRALTTVPGVYVPRFYTPRYENDRLVGWDAQPGLPLPVRRTYVADLERVGYPVRPVVPLIEAVQDRLTLEIQRGCTHGCRFCQAGIFYRPMRERSPRTLIELVVSGLAATGWDEISLSSLSSADYSQIEPLARALMDGLADGRTGISFSSLRADTFGVELAQLVARVRKSGLTFAPEAGTQRLRDVINKGIRDEDLLEAVAAAYARGWRRVKLYFMIGLPTETRADIEGLVDLVHRLHPIGRASGAGRGVTVSVGAFVPKAHTPFQWEPFADRAHLRESIDFLRARLNTSWSQLKTHAIEPAVVEAIIARGDRRCARLIHRVWELGGRFEGWSEHFDAGRWERALADCGLDALEFTGARDPQATLPWEIVDLGVTQDWLRGEREKALRGEKTGDCRTAPCTMCGLGGPRDRKLAPALADEEWAALVARLRGADATAGAMAARDAAAGASAAAGTNAAAGTGAATGAAEPSLERWRLVFHKLGPQRFIAHLETGRLLMRLLRMAQWPLGFTLGHNPHPRLSFGPPLPLGVEGERELLDLHLTRSVTAEDLTRLNAIVPRGLSFLAVHRVAREAASLTAVAIAASYRVELPAELAAQARRERRIEAFAEAGAVTVSKPSKGRARTIDIKRCVQEIAWDEGENAVLRMRLLLQERDGQVLGPLPLLREIFRWGPEEVAQCRVTRLRIVDQDSRGLDEPAP